MTLEFGTSDVDSLEDRLLDPDYETEEKYHTAHEYETNPNACIDLTLNNEYLTHEMGGTLHSPVVTLANSIVGVSVLAMPFCFKQCGVILASLMLVASALITRTVCYFLLKSSILTRRRTYELLAYHTLGRGGKFIVEISMIGFLLGTLVAFLVVMGDLGPQIVASVFNIENNGGLRSVVMSALALFVALPLALLRDIESLSSVSTASFLFYGVLVLKILTEGATPEYESIELWRPAGVLQCIPIIAMALSCQTQIFSIYESLPEQSLQKMNSIVGRAVNICTLFYILVGFFGYIAIGGTSGNILLNLNSSWSTDMIKCGFVMSIVFSFPLCVFPCRASLYSLLFRGSPHAHPLQETHMPDQTVRLLTVGIVGVTLVIGLIIPNIELVLGLVGSTAGALVCIIFPSILFIKVTEGKATTERLMAKFLLSVGLVILCLTTYVTLYEVEKAETGHKSLELEYRHAGDLNQVELQILRATSEKGDVFKEKPNLENPVPVNKDGPVPVPPIVPQEFLESLKQQQEEQKKLIEEQKSILEQLQVHANDHKKQYEEHHKPSSPKPIEPVPVVKLKTADVAVDVPEREQVIVHENKNGAKDKPKDDHRNDEIPDDKRRGKPVIIEPVVEAPNKRKSEHESNIDDNDRGHKHVDGKAKTKHLAKVADPPAHKEQPERAKEFPPIPEKNVDTVLETKNNVKEEGIHKLNADAENINADAAKNVKTFTKINVDAMKPAVVVVKDHENQKGLPEDNHKADRLSEPAEKPIKPKVKAEDTRKVENFVVPKEELGHVKDANRDQTQDLKPKEEAKPKPEAMVKDNLQSGSKDDGIKMNVEESRNEIQKKVKVNNNQTHPIPGEKVIVDKDKTKVDRDM